MDVFLSYGRFLHTALMRPCTAKSSYETVLSDALYQRPLEQTEAFSFYEPIPFYYTDTYFTWQGPHLKRYFQMPSKKRANLSFRSNNVSTLSERPTDKFSTRPIEISCRKVLKPLK
ncbi:hypothetical protein AVEN_90852-1 [Araneus ventricosus]|uniref:Uncharacterized protein n=1 Tax=Araneus ventricosus TaxID=182803 RepID=A0A4Y2LDS0_ARAVE|nr:hypothetical protein AVEN_90852-1 [Araneus ventricosus]